VSQIFYYRKRRERR